MNSFRNEEKMNPDWADLPKHVLDLIVKQLDSFKDYLQFGATCVAWYDVLKHNKKELILNTRLSNHFPMLITPSEEENSFNIYDPVSNKLNESKLLIPYNKRFGGSSQGWLVTVNEDFTVTLYKPTAYPMLHENTTIHLPRLVVESSEISEEELVEICDYFVYKATITADPILDPNDCVVLVICDLTRELSFIRPSKDIEWTKIDLGLQHIHIHDILFHNDKWYALYLHDKLIAFDIDDPHQSQVTLVETEEEKGSFEIKPYLVKSCGGDIMQVKRYFALYDNDVRTLKVKVFKLIFEDLKFKWIEITNLGDAAMFLGDNSSICVRASEFNGCKSNCIYFNHDYDLVEWDPVSPSDYIVYNLEDRSFENCTIDNGEDDELGLSVVRMIAQQPIWIVTPTLNVG